MAKKQWSAWSRDFIGAWGGVVAGKPIPDQKITIRAIDGLGEPSYSVADQADAATAISHTVDAWAVVDSEHRRAIVDGVIHSDRRDVRIGWVLRCTRHSRWQGEGKTTEWFFVPGKDLPSVSEHLDGRWGDSHEDRNKSTAIEFSRVRELS